MKQLIKKIWKTFRGNLHFLLGMRSNERDTVALKKLLKRNRFNDGYVELKNYTLHYCDSLSFYHQYREIVGNQIYKFSENKTSPKLIIDCGANIGLSSLYLRNTYPEARIIAFEPNPAIFKLLQKNTGEKNIETKQVAVWERDGHIHFNADHADASSVIYKDGDSRSLSVPCERLSKYLLEKVDFLKIDIEGAELTVIREISANLKNVENIFIEYHAADLHNKDLEEILSILTGSGFRYYLKPQSVPASPFMYQKPASQNFYYQINIFAFR